MFCGFCGTELAEEARFCPHCGAAVDKPAGMPGAQVNQQVAAGAQVNQQVAAGAQVNQQVATGAQVNQQVAAGAQVNQQAIAGSPIAEKKKGSLFLKIFIPVMLVVVIASVVTFFVFRLTARSTPEKTIKQMEATLNRGDFKGFLKCCDSDIQEVYENGNSFIGEIAEEAGLDVGNEALGNILNGLGGLFSALGQMPKFEMEVEEVDYQGKNHCVVYVTTTIDVSKTLYGSGLGSQSFSEEIPMVCEDGVWKAMVIPDAVEDMLN